MKTNEMITKSFDRLMGQMKSVINDAEKLLRTSEKPEADAFKKACATFEETLDTAKAELHDMEESVVEKVRDAALNTDKYVHEHPWNTVVTGAFVGLLAGLLITRK